MLSSLITLGPGRPVSCNQSNFAWRRGTCAYYYSKLLCALCQRKCEKQNHCRCLLLQQDAPSRTSGNSLPILLLEAANTAGRQFANFGAHSKFERMPIFAIRLLRVQFCLGKEWTICNCGRFGNPQNEGAWGRSEHRSKE